MEGTTEKKQKKIRLGSVRENYVWGILPVTIGGETRWNPFTSFRVKQKYMKEFTNMDGAIEETRKWVNVEFLD